VVSAPAHSLTASTRRPDPSFWQGRRVLLTGHTGFKGSWLLLWLEQLGARVWGFSLAADQPPNLFRELATVWPASTLDHREGDLADRASLEQVVHDSQPEVVLHLAAQSLVRRGYVDPLGTWTSNVMGSLHLLEALRSLEHPCAVVMVTTDKVYANREWLQGYRESDRLGGHDPYSASKAGAELAIASWRASFCGALRHQTPWLRIATARSGNVIGGGDWAEDRIVPDAIRALHAGDAITLRHPESTRPWQHVLEPLAGYLVLAEALCLGAEPPCEAFNFGPCLASNRTVHDLVAAILAHWPGSCRALAEPVLFHEAGRLHLQIDKAHHQLGWSPRWDFDTTVARTVGWYKSHHRGADALGCCLEDLEAYRSC
jgi:CDP-glucose 4,6-dehydratase